MKLKWAFGFPGAEIMWGQPTITDGRIFIGVDTGADQVSKRSSDRQTGASDRFF